MSFASILAYFKDMAFIAFRVKVQESQETRQIML